jgi:hypothetical protein
VTEPVRLTVPRARPFHGVVHLVVGGLAARQDLPYDALEDLQLALDTLLETDGLGSGEDVTVELTVVDGGLELAVGPLDARALERDLSDSDDERRGVGLARLLSTVTGGYSREQRDGAEWLRFRKQLPAPSTGGG